MRSILVYADRGKGMAARMETALALARVTGGHVSVIVDSAVARYSQSSAIDLLGGSFMSADGVGGGGFGGTRFGAGDAIVESLAHDGAYAEQLDARLAREDVAYDVILGEDEPVHALADAARLADVVVLSRDCDFAGALALSTRCPILLVPANDPAQAANDHQPGAGGMRMPIARAAIAWDGGEEAAAALRAVIPLLIGSSPTCVVHVLTVDKQQGGFPSTAALRYLSRHGIKAEFIDVERVGSIEHSLAAAIAGIKADLLVMGAYGRSRMREYLFGGVTRYFLNTDAGPALFMAH